MAFLQQLLLTIAGAVVTVAVPAAVLVVHNYTGIQISAANEDSIRSAAMTEAGKLITQGIPVTQAAADVAARKVMNDLPSQVKAEGYLHPDISDMVAGSAAVIAATPVAVEAIAKVVGKK